jgi:ribosome assembly protein 1
MPLRAQSIRNEKMIAKIVKLLELNVPPRDLASNDPQTVKRAVMGAWLPVSTAVLGLVVEHLPSPAAAQKVLFYDCLFID